jgi:hypothetical protein
MRGRRELHNVSTNDDVVFPAEPRKGKGGQETYDVKSGGGGVMRKVLRKEVRKEGRKEDRKEGRKEGRKMYINM